MCFVKYYLVINWIYTELDFFSYGKFNFPLKYWTREGKSENYKTLQLITSLCLTQQARPEILQRQKH
jgi:hypothetical protein